jgi:hypothetical protein
MAKTRRFQRTLSAVKRAGATQGEIGDALRGDIIADLATDGNPIHRLGYFGECEIFLRSKGYVFDGEYLRQLYRVSAITAREEWLRGLDQLEAGRSPCVS